MVSLKFFWHSCHKWHIISSLTVLNFLWHKWHNNGCNSLSSWSDTIVTNGTLFFSVVAFKSLWHNCHKDCFWILSKVIVAVAQLSQDAHQFSILKSNPQISMAQASQDFFLFSLKFPWHKCHKNFSNLLSNSRGTSVTRFFSIFFQIPMAHVSQDFFLVTLKFPWHKCHKDSFSQIDAIDYYKPPPNLT